MRKLLLIPFLLCSCFSLAQTRYLVPYRDGNLWGYADTNLRMVVTPKYDEANLYDRGYATVQKNKLLGYLNSKGKEVVAPIYNQISFDYSDYALVTKGKNMGIIYLPTGKPVLPLIYTNISIIGENIFIVTMHSQTKGLFDAITKRWLLAGKYEEISIEKWGDQINYYIARKGSNVTKFSISGYRNFKIMSVGKIKPTVKEKALDLPMVSDEQIEEIKEEEVVQGRIETIGAAPYHLNGKTGFCITYQEEGRITADSIPAVYDSICWARNDYQLFVAIKNGKQGVITLKNEVIMPFVYDEVKLVDSTPSHGIYVVKNDEKYGLARTNGLLLQCSYDTIWGTRDFACGFILVKNKQEGAFIYDERFSLFDRLIEAKYDWLITVYSLQANSFKGYSSYIPFDKKAPCIALISKNNKRGYIDLKGNEFFKN